MTSTRDSIETLVAKIEQLERDLRRAQLAREEQAKVIATQQDAIGKLTAESEAKDAIIVQQRNKIGNLRKKLQAS